MKQHVLTILVAVMLLLGFASCTGNENDNPVYSTQPADTIADLDYLQQGQ